MKTLFLLIVLTQNGAGDINASFVNTVTLALCQQKAEVVSAVFIGSRIPILESKCVASNLQFTAFEHAATSQKINNFYLIDFAANAVLIKKADNWHHCVAQANKADSEKKLYCASSVQSLAE